MKKFIRGSFITAGILILIGLILLLACASVGGVSLFKEAVRNNEFSFGGGRFDGAHIFYSDDFDWEEDGYPTYAGVQNNIAIGDGSSIKKVDIEIDDAELEIKESADNQVRLDCAVKGRLGCYIEDDTLILRGGKYSDNHNDKISLYLPEGLHLDDIEIKLGTGKIAVNSLSTNMLCAEAGAGSMSFQNADVRDTELSAGVGQIDFKGNISGDIDASCGVGSINMQIKGNKDNWNYDVECAAGKVIIEEDEYENLVRNIDINYEADNDCDIACAIGKVKLSFY